MRGADSARSSALEAPGLTVTRSSAPGAMRLSLRIARIALTVSITGWIRRSASAFRRASVARGKGATMMESP